MSAARSFADVGAVREAVAKSLGFGVREQAPYDEVGPDDASGELHAEPAAEAEAALPDAEGTETEADRALQTIMERIEAEEGPATEI